MILTIQSHVRENEAVLGVFWVVLGSDVGLQGLLMRDSGSLGMVEIDL